jgi:hypothetical protein
MTQIGLSGLEWRCTTAQIVIAQKKLVDTKMTTDKHMSSSFSKK